MGFSAAKVKGNYKPQFIFISIQRVMRRAHIHKWLYDLFRSGVQFSTDAHRRGSFDFLMPPIMLLDELPAFKVLSVNQLSRLECQTNSPPRSFSKALA